jgi:hypothetical protein
MRQMKKGERSKQTGEIARAGQALAPRVASSFHRKRQNTFRGDSVFIGFMTPFHPIGEAGYSGVLATIANRFQQVKPLNPEPLV